MRYFSIYTPDPKTNTGHSTAQYQQEMGKFVEESTQRGELIMGGGFLSITKSGAVLRRSNGRTSVIDGPYAESKELLGGFAILEFSSREAAIEGGKRFLQVAGDGECVTYQLMQAHPTEA